MVNNVILYRQVGIERLDTGEMNMTSTEWTVAVKTLATSEDYEVRCDAALVIMSHCDMDDSWHDWVVEGAWDGTESIHDILCDSGFYFERNRPPV